VTRQPVLAGYRRTSGRPFPIQRLLLVPIVGGIVPTAVLYWANTRRLPLGPSRERKLASLTAAAALVLAGLGLVSEEGFGAALLIWDRPVAVVYWLLARLNQRAVERAYHERGGYVPGIPTAVAAMAAGVALTLLLKLAFGV